MKEKVNGNRFHVKEGYRRKREYLQFSKYIPFINCRNTNFFKGMGTVFSIGGNYFSFDLSRSGTQLDKKAVASDWQVVGDDIRSALHQVLEQEEKALGDGNGQTG